MSFIDGRILLSLLAISCTTNVIVNALQELSEFQLPNEVIYEENLIKLDSNTESPNIIENTTETSKDKEQLNPNFFGNKENEDLGMDTVTLIWYLTTFTALFGFFIVMACTENTCNRRSNSKPAETRNATPSPCPSYKHFAPPTYASVMKKIKDPKVFIVPVHESNNNFFTNPADVQNQNTSECIERNETIVSVSR